MMKADNVPDKLASCWYKHNANAQVHLQLLCAQRGKQLGFSWHVESSGNQKLTYDLPTKFCSIYHRLAVI